MPAMMPTAHERKRLNRGPLDDYTDADLEAMSNRALSRLMDGTPCHETINKRRKMGCSARQASLEPAVRGGKPVPDSLKGRANAAGMDYSLVHSRVARGWSVEDALTRPRMSVQEAAEYAGRVSARRRREANRV